MAWTLRVRLPWTQAVRQIRLLTEREREGRADGAGKVGRLVFCPVGAFLGDQPT